MTPHRVVWPVADRDGIAVAQTTAGATALNLSTAALYVPAVANTKIKLHGLAPISVGAHCRMPAGTKRTVTLFSAGNLAALTFTVTGILESGAVDTEAIVGPGAGLTVEGTKEWVAVTSVVPNGAVGTAVEVGSGFKGATLWYNLLNSMQPKAPFGVGLFVKVPAVTISATVQYTPDNVFESAMPDFVAIGSEDARDHPDLTAVGVNDDANLAFPAAGVRCKINSSDATGNLVFTAIAEGR